MVGVGDQLDTGDATGIAQRDVPDGTAGLEGVSDRDGDRVAVVEPDLDVLDVDVGVAYLDPESVDRSVPPPVARGQCFDVGTALVRDANVLERQLLGGCVPGERQCQAGDE